MRGKPGCGDNAISQAIEKRVAVIGGGYAGIAAAVTLAQQHVPVTVFEAAKQLGGRARRVDYRGLTLDNGEHLLLGAYRETLRLVGLVAPTNTALFSKLPLDFTIPGQFKLRAAHLPAPFHLVVALLTTQGLTLSERGAAIRFMLKMQRQNFSIVEDTSVSTLLERHHQGAKITRFLWGPMCTAALNTPPEIASAQVFLNVLRDSLSGRRGHSDFILPRCDLSKFLPDNAAAYIAAQGGEVRIATTITSIECVDQHLLLTSKGRKLVFSHVICAVAPHQLDRLIAQLPALDGIRRMVDNFAYQPIYTVYLQYPPSVRLEKPLLGLIDGLAQWVFDRGQTHDKAGLLAVVISATGAHQLLTQDALAAQIQAELKCVWADLPPFLWCKVIAEKRATFSCTINLPRPSQMTPLSGFYLAGDYTAGDYPATLEAAVQSGIKCATAILESV